MMKLALVVVACTVATFAVPSYGEEAKPAETKAAGEAKTEEAKPAAEAPKPKYKPPTKAQIEKDKKMRAPDTGNLDGKFYQGELASKSGDQKKTDTLIFKKGHFSSSVGESQGYGTGSYYTKGKTGDQEFQASVFSSKGERMDWKGHIKGKAITATINKVSKDGATEEWTFEGKLRTK